MYIYASALTLVNFMSSECYYNFIIIILSNKSK